VKRALRLLLCFAIVACSRPVPKAPAPPAIDLLADIASAQQAELTDDAALDDYLRALEHALAKPTDPRALDVVLASIDALVMRRVEGLPISVDHALAHRTRGNLVRTAARLRALWLRSHDRFEAGPATAQRAFVAEALHQLALRVGASEAGGIWRKRAGCIPEATVVGPLRVPALVSLAGDRPFAISQPLPATLPGVSALAPSTRPRLVETDACGIDFGVTGSLDGERLAIVDLALNEARTVWLALSSSSAAEVLVGDQSLLQRDFAASRHPVTRIARAELSQGWTRVVVRVASRGDGGRVRLALWSDDGARLAMRAPRAGDAAPGRMLRGEQVQIGAAQAPRDVPLATTALLAVGEDRRAAELLAGNLTPPLSASSATLDTLRLRVLDTAHNQPDTERVSALKSTAERILTSCPACWEAQLAKARVARHRKGHRLGGFAALEALGVSAVPASAQLELAPDASRPALAMAALTANQLGLVDVARAAYGHLARLTPDSPLLADVDAIVHRRIGPEGVRAACGAGRSRAQAACLRTHISQGNLDATLDEVQRLRELRGASWLYRDVVLSQWLKRGDLQRALGTYRAMAPAQRALASLGIATDTPLLEVARNLMRADMRLGRDAPYAYEPLARILGVVGDPSEELEQQGALLVARDRGDAFLPGAATAVLKRVEHYELNDDGILRHWIYDLRRVSGTQDVAAGTHIGKPRILGRAVERTLRRRIHKKDGRIIDPDPQSRGAQAHTELSQLQAGDYVEIIVEGWALPGEHGQLVVDTADLLPARTSVRLAEVSFVHPKDVTLSTWTHPRLGAATVRQVGDTIESRWHLSDQPARTIELGGAPLEARVALSFGTDSYERIASTLDERQRALDERDGFMRRWITEAVGDDPSLDAQARIGLLVAAVGRAVRRADPDALSDSVAALETGAQHETARIIIERGTGSRSWVIHRGLRELGFTSEIIVAERQPVSADPSFPVRPGRFQHPLVRVETAEGTWLWIDADVDGPPLPPGRISPELRGRTALLVDGTTVTVEGSTAPEPDVIDMRLELAPDGSAHGSFTALLHGRAAQQLSDALEIYVGDQRRTLLRNVVLAWMPRADVGDVTLSSQPGSWMVAVRADLRVIDFLAHEGRDDRWFVPGIATVHAVYPRAFTTTLLARYAKQAERSTALTIADPLLYRVRRTIKLPPGMKVRSLVTDVAVEEPLLEATRVVSLENNTIVDELNLDLAAGSIPLSDSVRFIGALRRVDEGFMFGCSVGRASAGESTP